MGWGLNSRRHTLVAIRKDSGRLFPQDLKGPIFHSLSYPDVGWTVFSSLFVIISKLCNKLLKISYILSSRKSGYN